MVDSYVHLLFADWRKEEFQTGESVMIQERPSSLWGSPREDGKRGALDLPRTRGALTEGRLWPKPTETLPETWRSLVFAVKLTLDAATAHPALFLSEEGRRVTWQEPCQELPSSPERFVSIPCVLGQLYVSSGRYFWEVEVQNAHSWDLGVCRNNVERNGRVTMSPQNGFWAIRLYNGDYWGLTSPETSLTLKEKPCKVGVFLDYEAGDVSFYNMTDGSHIYTFSKQTFYGVLRPLFRLWSSGSGPLTIVQVE